MRIELVSHGSSAALDWDAYAERSVHSSAYHRMAWRSIFETGFDYPSWYLLARGDNQAVLGVLPLFLVRSPLSRRLVAVPFRDRGGVLWESPEAFGALVSAAADIARQVGSASMTLKSLSPYPDDLVASFRMRESRYWIHSAVDMSRLTPETLWHAIGDKNRNMVRQARRHGLNHTELEPNKSNLRAWHRLHVATQRRLGLPAFPMRFFTAMAENLAASRRMFLLGVMEKDSLRAATILLPHREAAIYAYSASDITGQRMRANDLLLYETMCWCVDRGFTTFDLGSDSPLQESLLFFKRKWLATQRPAPHYMLGEGRAAPMDSSSRRYSIARACIRRMPNAAVAALGAAFVRYFG